MPRIRSRAWLTTITAAALLAAGPVAAATAAPQARTARAAAAATPLTATGWHHGQTCVPQATRWGSFKPGGPPIVRVDNDLFAGASGPSCIKTTNGHDFCVLSNYKPWPYGVVGFPQVRVGPFDRSRDPGSGFPFQVNRVPNLVVHAEVSGCDGTAPSAVGGNWLGEIHMWFYNSDAIRGHGKIELVVVMDSHNWTPYCTNSFRVGSRAAAKPEMVAPPMPITMGHQPAALSLWYCGNEHKTGGRGHMWPIIVMRLLHPRHHLGLHVRPLFAKLRHLHWLGGGRWLGNIEVGGECAAGCKSFYGSMVVTGLPAQGHKPCAFGCTTLALM